VVLAERPLEVVLGDRRSVTDRLLPDDHRDRRRLEVYVGRGGRIGNTGTGGCLQRGRVWAPLSQHSTAVIQLQRVQR